MVYSNQQNKGTVTFEILKKILYILINILYENFGTHFIKKKKKSFMFYEKLTIRAFK